MTKYEIRMNGFLGKLFKNIIIEKEEDCWEYDGTYRLKYALDNITEKLSQINESLNNNVNTLNISSPVWILNVEESNLKLTNSISVNNNSIMVDGVRFANYDSHEEVMKEMDQIISWISSENIMGKGIYQLTK